MKVKAKRIPLVPINEINFARCGAKGKRSGQPCQQPSMKNGKCRLHGGRSTGPKTAEGIERVRQANMRHGFYTAEAKAERKQVRELFKQFEEVLKDVREA